MVSVALLIRIAAASIISSTAFAADMPQPLPQRQIRYQPIPVVMEEPQGESPTHQPRPSIARRASSGRLGAIIRH